jgi:hypothetical protein
MHQLLSRWLLVSPPAKNLSTPSRLSSNSTTLVIAIIIAGIAIRCVLAATFGFGHGEAYYYSCARHLDWSYFDHPPMHAWLAHAAMYFGPAHPLLLRAPFILFFAGTTWLLFILGRKLFGTEAGLFAVVIFNLSPVFTLTTAIWLQPDSPLMFFWLMTFYFLVRLLIEEKPRWATAMWLGVGVCAGIAMLCKYHAVFLAMGTFVYVISRKDQRHWLAHPGPYLAVAVMALAFTPILLWNAENGWISFLWQGGRGTSFQGLHVEWLVRSIVGQTLWLLPWIWVPLIRELYQCIRRGPGDRVHWLIACLASPPILFFTITAIYAPYGFHFHWQAPGYLLLFMPLGATVARMFNSGEQEVRRVHRWLKFTAIVFAVSTLALYSHTLTGWAVDVLPSPLDSQLAKDDPTLEGLQFSPLEPVLAEKGFLDRKDIFICTPKWFLSGKVDYALHGRAEVLCLSPDDARSFAFLDEQERWLGKDALLITDNRFSEGMEKKLIPNFEKMTLLTTVDVPRGNRIGARLYVFYCEKFTKTVPQTYGKSMETHVLAGYQPTGISPE